MRFDFRQLGFIWLLLLAVPRLPVCQPRTFERLSSELGLSQNMINCIEQDHKGFLWVGTRDGLNRFDGYRFKVFRFDSFDTCSISNNNITGILEDRSGHMWVATDDGLNLFDREKEIFHPLPANLNLTGEHLQEDIRGNLWLGGSRNGLAVIKLPPQAQTLEGLRITLYRPDTIDTSTPGLLQTSTPVWDHAGRGLLRRSDGRCIRVSYDSLQQTFRFDTNFADFPDDYLRQVLENDAPDILKLIQGPDATVWFVLRRELLRWDAQSRICTRYPVPEAYLDNPFQLSWEYFRAGIVDSRNRIWLGGYSGTFRFDIADEKWTNFSPSRTASQHLLYYGVNSLMEDNSGIIWLGTSGNGLMKYDDNARRFTTAANAPGLWEGASLRSICKTTDGRLWIAPTVFGLYWFDPERRSLQKLSSPHAIGEARFGPVSGLYQNKDGALWAGCTKGLMKLTHWERGNPEIEWFETEHLPEEPGQFYAPTSIVEDAGNILWMTCPDALRRFDPKTKTFEAYPFFNSDNVKIAANPYPVLFQDRRGILWIGLSEGLWRFDPTEKRFRKYQNNRQDPHSLSHYLVKSIAEDPAQPDRYLWVGTGGGGLNRFDLQTEQFENFTEKDGLPDRVIYGILPDAAGNIWLSTNKGISAFDPKRRSFRNFDKLDGLQDLEFNTLAFHRSADGQFFFGGIKGFNAFYPDRMLLSNTHVPLIVFTDFKISNKSVSVRDPGALLKHAITYSGEIVLHYDTRSFAFEFAALDFSDPAKNQFACIMEGFDQDWQYLGSAHSATYTNLSPGTYTFRVKGSNNDGVWNEQGASIRVIILPPWWRSWWAYAIYLLSLGGLLYWFRRKELRERELQYRLELGRLTEEQMKALDKTKSRLYANIAHEFRTPLTVILGMASQIEQHPSSRLREGLALIKRNGENLLMLINQMLDLSKLESNQMQTHLLQGNIVLYIKYLTESFQSIAEAKDINLRVSSSPASILMDYDPEKMQQIIYNLLSNAIKFTPSSGGVDVRLTLEEDAHDQEAPRVLSLNISDTGIGIPPDQLPYIFDRYYQAEHSGFSRGGGTGIGLALTQELVHLLGGRIAAASTPGQGTTITIQLPVTREAPLEAADASWSPSPAPVGNNVGEAVPAFSGEAPEEWPLLLIVEDNPDVRTFLVRCLEQHYRIETADNGQAGIEKALEIIPDIIISDVMMPEKDGFELCEALKNDLRSSHIPIVLLTARAEVEDRITGLKRGADAYLSKPFHQGELLAQLQSLLEARRRMQARYRNLTAPEPQAAPEEKAEDAFLLAFRALIEADLDNADLSIDAICRSMALSRMQLHRKIKALTDTSTALYIRSIRLQHAHRLLLSTDLTISEIAYQTGFDDPKYFSRVFTEAFGMPPSAVRT